MGDEAFYNLASHPESMKLTIQIVRMQDLAVQRQERERAQADPARNDVHLAQAVRVPNPLDQVRNLPVPEAGLPQNIGIIPASPVPNPDSVQARFAQASAFYAEQRRQQQLLQRPAARPNPRSNSSRGRADRAVVIDADRVEAVLDHAQNSQASHPAAVNPNTIQVWSANNGSSQARKRLMAVAGGEVVPTAQRPSIEGYLPSFLESSQAFRSAQEVKGNAAMLTAATSFIAFSTNLPDADPNKAELLKMGMLKAREILKLNHAEVSEAPVLPVQPPVPPPVVLPEQPPVQPSVSFEPLVCSICFATFEINLVRGTYTNCIFTRCAHAFHPYCLAEHRRTQQSLGRPEKCPNCNAPAHF